MEDFINSLNKQNYLNLTHIPNQELSKTIHLRQNVQQLVIQFTEIEGLQEKAQIISKEINLFKDLQYLQLNYTQYLGLENFIQLSSKLKKLNHLIALSLNVQLQYEGEKVYQIITEGISEFINLEHLNILAGYNSQLGQKGAEGIGLALSKMKKLKSLKILIHKQNNFNYLGCSYLSQGIKDLRQLKELNITIQNNNINSEGAMFIGEALKELINLQTLVLNIGMQNNIGPKGVEGLSEGFGNLTNLKSLNITILNDNNIESKGLTQIGLGLQNLNQLLKLYLYLGRKNKIESEGMIGLGQGIKYLTNLNILQIILEENNYVKQEGILYLRDGIAHLQHINNLELSFVGNQLSTDGIIQLAEIISTQKKLKTLKISVQNNQLSSQSLMKFSEAISSLYELEKLTLTLEEKYEILIDGTQYLFYSFGNSQSLRLLNINLSFGFEADFKNIGNSFKKLVNLQELYITINKTKVKSKDLMFLSNEIYTIKSLKDLQLTLSIKEIDENDSKKYLTQAINQLLNVQNLNLNFQDSELKSAGMNQISDGLYNLKQLRSLSINSCKPQYYGRDSMLKLFNSIKQLKQLNQLVIIISERSLHIKEYAQNDSLMFYKFKRLVTFYYS